VLAFPGRLLTGPDPAAAPVGAPPAVWALLLGREAGGGLPPLWLGAAVFGLLWVAAALGLGLQPRRPTVIAAWLVALVAMAMAVAVSRLVVRVPPTGSEARPWAGVYLLIAFAALVLAAAGGLDGLAARIGRRSFSALQPLSVLAGVLAATVTVGAAAWWVLAGASGPIQRTSLEALPPYVRNAMLGDAGVRVLAVELAGDQARYAVLADDQIRLGDADRGFAYGASTAAPGEVEDLVLRLLAGTADSDIAPQLRDLGIGFLWVQGASEDERSRIDNTPGVGTASGSGPATVWQLQPPVTRITVRDQNAVAPVSGQPPQVPAGSPNRVLRTGEPADPRWRAELDDTVLAGSPDGWQQTFSLPGGGGALRLQLTSISSWLLIAQGAVLAVAVVLAAPGIRRPEVRDPARVARRAATIGGAGL
jgi:hypothetical protein